MLKRVMSAAKYMFLYGGINAITVGVLMLVLGRSPFISAALGFGAFAFGFLLAQDDYRRNGVPKALQCSSPKDAREINRFISVIMNIFLTLIFVVLNALNIKNSKYFPFILSFELSLGWVTNLLYITPFLTNKTKEPCKKNVRNCNSWN